MVVCLDASIVVKWIVVEEKSDRAMELLVQWEKEPLVAPAFMQAEVTSVLRKKYTGER